MNIRKLSIDVIDSIAANLGWDGEEDKSPYLEQIKHMTINEAFDRYCTWHGFLGWGQIMQRVLKELGDASEGDNHVH